MIQLQLIFIRETNISSPPSSLAVTIQWTGLLDWTTTGLDYYWTGLLDWTTGLKETVSAWGEKGTTMRRAKTPSHKVCSSVVVTHLKVASSSVPSYSALFFLLLYLDGNLGVATPRPRTNKCACMGTIRV